MYASLGRLPGAKVRLASPDVTVPPSAARISTEPDGGGARGDPGAGEGSGACGYAGAAESVLGAGDPAELGSIRSVPVEPDPAELPEGAVPMVLALGAVASDGSG